MVRSHLLYRLIATTALVGLPLALHAQATPDPQFPKMEDLGALPADNPSSYAQIASGDGSVVFGRSDDAGSNPRVFRWTDSGGIQDLGTLRADDTGRAFITEFDRFSHRSFDYDGTVIAGNADADSGFANAFRWTEADGMVDLGTLTADGFGGSMAITMSPDGSVVGGRAWTDANNYQAVLWRFGANAVADDAAFETLALGTLRDDDTGFSEVQHLGQNGSIAAGRSEYTDGFTRHAFRWTETDSMVDLGTLRAGNDGYSNVYDMTSDGSVLVGNAATDRGANAVLWRFSDVPAESDTNGAPAFETVDLGILTEDGTGSALARMVTGDGRVVVGDSPTSGNHHAFRWTETSGMVDLGNVGSGDIGYSVAYGMSDDGNVIVGGAENESRTRRAVVWRFGDAGASFQTVDLGTLRADNGGQSYAQHVSADGTVVVGQSDTDDDDRVFRWTAADGMVDLGSLRADNLGRSYPYFMSRDGDVIVGSAETDDGSTRAFAWRGAMVDLANTQATVQMAAAGVGAASAEYNANAMRLLDRELDLKSGGDGDGILSTQGRARAPVVLSFGAGLSRNADVGSYGRADVTGAMGLGGGYVLGGFLEVANERKTYGLVTLSGSQVSGGLSVRYRDNADFSGLTWRLASQFGTGDSTITRAAILPGTFSGSGKAGLDSGAVSAELGWGYAVEGGVVIPFARIAAARTTRDAYTETTAAAFPLSYDRHRESVSTVTLGLDSRIAVGTSGTLRLSGGMVHDLDRDRNPITGTSAIPGMATFSVAAPAVVNKTRAFGFVSYRHELDPRQAITTSFGMAQQAWTGKPSSTLRVGYEVRF